MSFADLSLFFTTII